jgi:lipoprotein
VVRRCFFAVLICAALVAAACGRAAQQIESDPALDAQGILSRALNQGESEQLISDHDQTVKMNTVLKTSMEGATVTLNMRLDSKRSGEQRMSEVGAEIKVSAEAGRNNSAKFYVLFQQEENEYHAYARLEKGATSSKRGQEVLSEEGMQDVLGQVQESSMASVEMYAENPEKIAAKEDNGTYVVQLVPSHEALMKILNRSGSGGKIDDLSNSYCLLTLTVDKSTYRMKNFTMELNADVTVQGKKAKMDLNVDMTSDETQEVTLSIPPDLQDAPETSLKTFFSS